MSLLALHKKWVKYDKLPSHGLCRSIPKKYTPLLELVSPTNEDLYELRLSDWPNVNEFWGVGAPYKMGIKNAWFRARSYTPLRQNLMLLMAALNNEL